MNADAFLTSHGAIGHNETMGIVKRETHQRLPPTKLQAWLRAHGLTNRMAQDELNFSPCTMSRWANLGAQGFMGSGPHFENVAIVHEWMQAVSSRDPSGPEPLLLEEIAKGERIYDGRKDPLLIEAARTHFEFDEPPRPRRRRRESDSALAAP